MADGKEEVPESPDVYFEPLVNLPPVETITCEENEDELLKLRAKLFRYDAVADPPEWKERGLGDVKILKNQGQSVCRVVMRRDKTLKICANHYILPHMELKPNCGSDRAWIWNTPADFADEEPKNELLAIRFANAENAQLFKEKFSAAKTIMKESMARLSHKKKEQTDTSLTPADKTNGAVETDDKETSDVANQLESLTVRDTKSSDATSASDTKSSDATSASDTKSSNTTSASDTKSSIATSNSDGKEQSSNEKSAESGASSNTTPSTEPTNDEKNDR